MEPPLPAIRDRRPDALGDLRVLEDETLCAIFDLLSPCDLARLSCVSSVMYILCNEEPLWMSQCLRDGGLLEYKGTWKKTTLYRQNLFSKTEVCERPLQFDGFNSWFLYKRWYRCFTNLDKFASDSGVIERRGNIDLEEFQSEYDGKKPVLLTELARNWPARIKWTVDQLSLNYGDVAFRISQRSSRKVTMKLRDYVSYLEVQHDEDPLYIFDEKFGESAPVLLNDYTVPSLFQEDFFDVLDPDKRPPFRWLIIGPERSGASWHVDPALTSAWNTLLVGRKRWALYPPGRVPAGVTVHVNEEDGDINIDGPTSLQWWLDIYPLLADRDKPLECTQLPGETIFVPSGWWHCVLNLETTVAVTQNFVNKSNFEFVCLDMAPGHRHKGVCRAGLLAVEDNILKDVERYKFSKTNILDNSDKARKVKRLKGSDHMGKQFQHNGNWHSGNALPPHSKILKDNFSYDISFLSTFLEENRDHYCSVWSPSNCIGQREMREWLYKLWVTKPVIRELTWKGAELVLGIEKWYACLVEVCARHNLPPPLDHEKFPVGTGSNPVYLVSDYVIKIYVEGGLNYSIYGLGTELQFYHILQSTNSPLKDHVPEVMASGILAEDYGFLKIFPWDGKAVPDVIANCKLAGDYVKDGFPFGLWSKRKTEPTADPRTNEHTNIWPYVVTKRCKGDIFANLRDALSMDDALHLAAFLGEQLRNLHLLPLPLLQNSRSLNVNEAYARLSSGNINIPLDCELIIMSLNGRRREVQKRLSMWGDPIPRHLIEMADAYLPHDLAMLLDLIKDDNGLYTIGVSPTWIHSDIMDDNIHMGPFQPSFGQSSSVNGEVDAHDAEQKSRKWQPTHIIDFSDLQVGDPLYDFIPIHLDVFRGDTNLLEQLLRSYRLSFSKTSSAHGEETPEKCKRISYRAMCYCILHDENVLGAIFSLWKELRTAKSWDEVEEAVWGKLNNYEGPQIEKAYEP